MTCPIPMRFFSFLVISLLLLGCTDSEKPYIERPLTELYEKGFREMCDKNFSEAADAFDEVERQYPYSAWAAKAQLMAGYCAFKDQKFDRAISTMDVFIALHPSSPHIAYAYYLRALAYYTNIGTVFRDRENAELGLQAFEEVIRRFPHTDYAQDAQFKSDFIREHLASQEMLIGMQYLKNKEYLSAMRRFGDLVLHYPCSILMPETLYRLIEAQVALGLFEGAEKTARMLEYNFPKESWVQLGKECLTRYKPTSPKPTVSKPLVRTQVSPKKTQKKKIRR